MHFVTQITKQLQMHQAVVARC